MSKLYKYIDSGNLHHAYLIAGEGEKIIPELFSFLEDIGVATKGNPNLWHGVFDTFTIDHARELKGLQVQRAFGEEVSGDDRSGLQRQRWGKFFIIQTEYLTLEAQQALLKVFEEPTLGTHFFIVTPRADELIPTLKSRLVVVSTPSLLDIGENQFSAQAQKFLREEKKDRLEFINQLIKKTPDAASDGKADAAGPLDPGEGMEISRSMKAEALLFLNNLEKALQEKTRGKRKEPADYSAFEEVWQCRKQMRGRGSSVKMLLEHLALVL